MLLFVVLSTVHLPVPFASGETPSAYPTSPELQIDPHALEALLKKIDDVLNSDWKVEYAAKVKGIFVTYKKEVSIGLALQGRSASKGTFWFSLDLVPRIPPEDYSSHKATLTARLNTLWRRLRPFSKLPNRAEPPELIEYVRFETETQKQKELLAAFKTVRNEISALPDLYDEHFAFRLDAPLLADPDVMQVTNKVTALFRLYEK